MPARRETKWANDPTLVHPFVVCGLCVGCRPSDKHRRRLVPGSARVVAYAGGGGRPAWASAAHLTARRFVQWAAAHDDRGSAALFRREHPWPPGTARGGTHSPSAAAEAGRTGLHPRRTDGADLMPSPLTRPAAGTLLRTQNAIRPACGGGRAPSRLHRSEAGISYCCPRRPPVLCLPCRGVAVHTSSLDVTCPVHVTCASSTSSKPTGTPLLLPARRIASHRITSSQQRPQKLLYVCAPPKGDRLGEASNNSTAIEHYCRGGRERSPTDCCGLVVGKRRGAIDRSMDRPGFFLKACLATNMTGRA